jgi:hypothetical protein
MSNNSLKFLVIFLGILIFLSFVFLLYGLYSKKSNTQVLSNDKVSSYSLNLNKSEKIDDVRVIDENKLLIVVSDGDQSYLIIYNLKENKVVSIIGR